MILFSRQSVAIDGHSLFIYFNDFMWLSQALSIFSIRFIYHLIALVGILFVHMIELNNIGTQYKRR